MGEPDAVETKYLTAKEKWGLFVDATQGLATWNLFDDRVTLRAYMRFQADATASKGDDALGDLGNSVNARRFSLAATGTIDHHFRYVFAYDFGPDTSLLDAYIEGIDSGLNIFGYNVGDFRVGFFQEPFSLERITSSYFSGFLERSLPVQTIAPGNNLGYMVHRSIKKQRMTWAVGFFSFGSKSEENNSSSSLSITGRITALPLWREDGRYLVHLGFAA